MQAAEQAAEGNKIFEKIKEALPFGTLPVFDLAELSADDANMGPNEVTKEYLATGFQNSNNPFDTAMPGPGGMPRGARVGVTHPASHQRDWQPALKCPDMDCLARTGRTGETFGADKPGENDPGAVDVGAAAQKVHLLTSCPVHKNSAHTSVFPSTVCWLYS